MRIIYLILYCFILFSCSKNEKITIINNAISDAALYAVIEKRSGSDTLIACGGSRYLRGDVFFSYDGGITWWAEKNIAEKALYDIIVVNDSTLCAVGYDGKLLFSKSFGNSWSLIQLDYLPLKSVKVINNKLFICGGIGLRTGIIYQCSLDGAVLKRDTFENEMSDIILAADNTLKCCGYGIVLSSSDNGQTWTADNAEGDFFKCFVETNDGLYAVGMSGVNLKYSNGNWNTVSKGNRITKNNLIITSSAYNFQSNKWISAGKHNVLYDLNESGKKSTLLKTTNDLHLNYNNISSRGSTFIACTDEGTIITLPAY